MLELDETLELADESIEEAAELVDDTAEETAELVDDTTEEAVELDDTELDDTELEVVVVVVEPPPQAVNKTITKLGTSILFITITPVVEKDMIRLANLFVTSLSACGSFVFVHDIPVQINFHMMPFYVKILTEEVLCGTVW